MDKQYSVQFFTRFVEAMQKFCRDYIEFDQAVELSGYLSLEIDNYKKERYVLSEMVHNTGDVISESYCVKAFKTMKRLPVRNNSDIVLRDNTNTQRTVQETSIHLRESPEQSQPNNIPYQLSSARQKLHSLEASSQYKQSFRQNRRNNLSSFAAGGPDTNSLPTSSFQQQPTTIQPRQSVQYLTSAAHNSPVMAIIPSVNDADAENLDGSDVKHITSSSDTVSEDNRGRKRSVQEETAPNKKEKIDNEMESLFSAATNIVSVAEGNYLSDRAVHQGNETLSHSEITDTSTSQTNTERLCLPDNIHIKEEADDILFIDSFDTKSNTEDGSGGENQQFASVNTSSSDVSSLQTCSTQWISRLSIKHQENTTKVSNACGVKYRCTYCGYQSNHKNNMEKHVRTHTKELHKCTQCSRQFADKGNLVYHLKAHRGELFCQVCHRTFMSAGGLRTHKKHCLVKYSLK